MRKFDSKTTAIVTLKTSREFHWRVRIAKALMYLACRVLGCGIEFKEPTP